MTTTPASGAADLRTAAQAVVDRWDTPLWKDVPATAEYIGRLRAALAAGQATAAQAVVQDDLITLRKPTTSAELLWLLKLAHLVISDVDKTLEETFAPAQPVAEPADTVVLNAAMRAIQQAIELIGTPTDERMRAVRRVLRGAVIVAEDDGKVAPLPGTAYAALPEPYCNAHDDADACYPDMFSEYQMRAFADATHTLRAAHGQAPAGAGGPLTDWDMRGHLAASLHCWHRLTANEAGELVAFVQRIAANGIKGANHDR